MKNILIISTLLLSSALASAQSIDAVSLIDIQTDETITLKDYQSSKGIVIIFMSAKCPYVKYYESRLEKMAKDYTGKGIVFLMVNANSTESIDMMKNQADHVGVAYLLDKSKELAKSLGAKKSPEAFLLNGNGEVSYSGAIDDNPQVITDVQTHYLRNAIDGLLNGEASVLSSRPIGCMIK